jgi:hypothetical protein
LEPSGLPIIVIIGAINSRDADGDQHQRRAGFLAKDTM